jgi:hypothetical protein
MEIEISGYKVLVDDEDFEKISRYKWRVSHNVERNQIYVTRSYHADGKTHLLGLHRFIMNCVEGDGVHVDHINHNTLDNRKSNLRKVDNQRNCFNRSRTSSSTGYKGVWYREDTGSYRAMVRTEGKRYNCGQYTTPEEAAHAYDKMALYLFKECAYLNFPKETYTETDILNMCSYIEKQRRDKVLSKYRGVTLHKQTSNWQAAVTCNKKRNYLGSYKIEEDAAIAYDKKALELLGDKAKLNFPKENYINEGAKE